MKYAFMLALLALVVFVSACISSNVKVDPNNGIIVNEFSADPVRAEADDAVRFFVDIENTGGTTAQCVTTELFGVDSWRDEFGNPLTILTEPVTSGFFISFFGSNLNACYTDLRRGQVCLGYNFDSERFSGSAFLGNSFLSFSADYCNSLLDAGPRANLLRVQPLLAPPVPSLNRPGQSYTAEWILRPPILPEGLSINYPITARTSYFYSTNAQINIPAMNKAEFKRKTDLGQSVVFPLAVENSFGTPIQIFASRGSSPIVVNPDSLLGNIQYESYRFEFANVGNGFPLPIQADVPGVPGAGTQSGFMLVTMSISGPGAFFSDCLGQSGRDIFIGGNVLGDWVKIRADQRVPIGCTIGIDRNQWVTSPLGTITITFNLQYRYFVDKAVNVNVIGVEGLSGSALIGSGVIPLR